MNQTLELLLPGLTDEFPNILQVILHEPSQKYGCYCYDGIHGLACFRDDESAKRFCDQLDKTGMKMIQVSFDEAREIAKARPMPVVSIMLMDSQSDPLIHYVR